MGPLQGPPAGAQMNVGADRNDAGQCPALRGRGRGKSAQIRGRGSRAEIVARFSRVAMPLPYGRDGAWERCYSEFRIPHSEFALPLLLLLLQFLLSFV